MALNTKTDIRAQSIPEILNQSFDKETQTLLAQALGFDGVGLSRQFADAMAMKKTVVGSITYFGFAAPGTAQATAKWACFKRDDTTGSVITWADGNSNFDNTASDLTALTYS